jgi:hypothetical protein
MVLRVTLDAMFGAAVVLPDLVARDAAATLRERASYSRYALLDRGSYDIDTLDAPSAAVMPIFASLVLAAARVTGRTSLAVTEARLLRLLPGDYLLAHHDRILEGNPVEVTADLSPASVPGAEVQYRRRGQVFFRFPCVPGSVAVVERGPTVTCNHTYVSKLHAGASVMRLVVLLR